MVRVSWNVLDMIVDRSASFCCRSPVGSSLLLVRLWLPLFLRLGRVRLRELRGISGRPSATDCFHAFPVCSSASCCMIPIVRVCECNVCSLLAQVMLGRGCVCANFKYGITRRPNRHRVHGRRNFPSSHMTQTTYTLTALSALHPSLDQAVAVSW